MSNRRAEIESEFDLMAYADGLLDEDPARRALVEDRLRAAPQDAARVAAYRGQNAALRRRYAQRVEDPVPERLYGVLERPATPSARATLRVVAMVALTTAAGVSGWWVGQSSVQPGDSLANFVEDARIGYLAPTPDVAAGIPVAGAGSLNWLSESISLSLRTPDLSDRGYTVVRKETVQAADDRMVRVYYNRADGRGFSLFLRPWWDRRDPKIELVRRDGIWLAYWRDGPLASVIASRLPREEVGELAREVRGAMRDSNRAAPAVRPEPPSSGLPGVAVGPDIGLASPVPPPLGLTGPVPSIKGN